MDFYKAIAKNKRKTVLYVGLTMIILMLLITILTYFIAPDIYSALCYSSLISLVIVSILYLNSTKITLSLASAKEITREQAPELYDVVEEMSVAAGIQVPKIYIIQDNALNAFACGTIKNGAIVFTTGILDALDREELQGVAGHEISHLRNGDSQLMTIIAGVGLAIGIISNVGLRILWFSSGNKRGKGDSSGAILILLAIVMLIFIPVATGLIQAALSRKREWVADDSSVELTRNPAGLRSALQKLSQESTITQTPHNSMNHIWIAEPEAKQENKTRKTSFFSSFMDTHPPIEKRIAHLEQLEGNYDIKTIK